MGAKFLLVGPLFACIMSRFHYFRLFWRLCAGLGPRASLHTILFTSEVLFHGEEFMKRVNQVDVAFGLILQMLILPLRQMAPTQLTVRAESARGFASMKEIYLFFQQWFVYMVVTWLADASGDAAGLSIFKAA